MKDKSIAKQVIVITGGASGIGFAMASIALDHNMIVFICDVEEKALQGALSNLQSKGVVYGHIADVSKLSDVKKFSEFVFSKVSHVNFLINNAGVAGALGFVWDTPVEVLRHIFEVNVVGILNCLHIFTPKMIQSNVPCNIVNMSSNAGLTSMPYFSQYQITKHAVVTLSESLHYELLSLTDKIHVSVVCPGFVNTNISHSSRNYPSDIRNLLFKHNEGLVVSEELIK